MNNEIDTKPENRVVEGFGFLELSEFRKPVIKVCLGTLKYCINGCLLSKLDFQCKIELKLIENLKSLCVLP